MAPDKGYKVDVFKKNIKSNMKRKLREKGWTNSRFATEAAVTRGMVSKWLRGDAAPGLGMLARICNAFDEGPEYFLTKHEKRKL